MTDRLPPLLVGARRGMMARLVATSVLHAGCAVATAVLVGQLVGAATGRLAWFAAAVALAVAGMGLTKYAERVLAEQAGQDYVHELRNRLVSSALTGDGGPSLGITIARTTNDLTSVRTWVAQGIAPMVAAVPLVLGSLVLLASVHWSIALTALVALLALGAVLHGLSGTAYERARALRRQRGRLASRVTDTLHARTGIRVGGGEERELRRIEEQSRRVASAAVARARTAGTLQAAAVASAAGLAAVAAVVGRMGAVRPADIAIALTIAGVLAAPLAEAGRIVAFRQNHRAAERIIAPQIARDARPRPSRSVAASRVPAGAGTLQVVGVQTPDGPSALSARAGDRIRVTGPDAGQVSDFLSRVAAPGRDDELEVVVDGWPHSRLDRRRGRELVGLAAAGWPLERGTIARAVRYRRPDLDTAAGTTALEQVGLGSTLATLERGERTELRRGGEPLTAADRARLQLARAVIGDPLLLVLDRIDSDLDEAGRQVLRQVVADHPGIVLFASDVPERVVGSHTTLELAG